MRRAQLAAASLAATAIGALCCVGGVIATQDGQPDAPATTAPTTQATPARKAVGGQPSRKPTRKPKASPTRASTPARVSFSNCSKLRAVHPAGVPAGHPAYARRLDRDRDGRACEVDR